MRILREEFVTCILKFHDFCRSRKVQIGAKVSVSSVAIESDCLQEVIRPRHHFSNDLTSSKLN